MFSLRAVLHALRGNGILRDNHVALHAIDFGKDPFRGLSPVAGNGNEPLTPSPRAHVDGPCTRRGLPGKLGPANQVVIAQDRAAVVMPPRQQVVVAQTASLLAATHLPLILHADAPDAPAADDVVSQPANTAATATATLDPRVTCGSICRTGATKMWVALAAVTASRGEDRSSQCGSRILRCRRKVKRRSNASTCRAAKARDHGEPP
jgi:hypothetical protein